MYLHISLSSSSINTKQYITQILKIPASLPLGRALEGERKIMRAPQLLNLEKHLVLMAFKLAFYLLVVKAVG